MKSPNKVKKVCFDLTGTLKFTFPDEPCILKMDPVLSLEGHTSVTSNTTGYSLCFLKVCFQNPLKFIARIRGKPLE